MSTRNRSVVWVLTFACLSAMYPAIGRGIELNLCAYWPLAVDNRWESVGCCDGGLNTVIVDQFMVNDMEAAKSAESNWTRRQWVPENKSHKNTFSEKLTDKPMWPEIAFPELIKTGFKDKYLYDLDHPVLKRLRGEE